MAYPAMLLSASVAVKAPTTAPVGCSSCISIRYRGFSRVHGFRNSGAMWFTSIIVTTSLPVEIYMMHVKDVKKYFVLFFFLCYLPRPCCKVGAVVSLTTMVTLTVAAISRSKARTTETCPVVRSTAKKSYKKNDLDYRIANCFMMKRDFLSANLNASTS